MFQKKMLIMIIFITFVFLGCNSTEEVIPQKVIEDRVPNGLAIRFNREISINEANEFAEKFSHYGLKNNSKAGGIYNIWSFWFNEDLVDNEEEFIKQLEQEDIVIFADFDPIILVD